MNKLSFSGGKVDIAMIPSGPLRFEEAMRKWKTRLNSALK